MGLSQETRPEMRHELSEEEQEDVRMNLRIELLSALRDGGFNPRAKCPGCERRLTPVEIVRGFTRDPDDVTTCCPGCKTRFPALLIDFIGSGAEVQINFYCPDQTLEKLRQFVSTPPVELLKLNPSVYRSAEFHFGSLHLAFAQIGEYYWPDVEVNDWKFKVERFLGQVPDTLIATVAAVSVHKVRVLRRTLGVKAFNGYTRD